MACFSFAAKMNWTVHTSELWFVALLWSRSLYVFSVCPEREGCTCAWGDEFSSVNRAAECRAMGNAPSCISVFGHSVDTHRYSIWEWTVVLTFRIQTEKWKRVKHLRLKLAYLEMRGTQGFSRDVKFVVEVQDFLNQKIVRSSTVRCYFFLRSNKCIYF